MPAIELPFSRDEFRTRRNRVREYLQANSMKWLLVGTPENIYYLTGYHTTGYFAFQTLILSDTGQLFLLTREIELEMVHRYSLIPKTHIFLYSDNEDLIARTNEVL